MSLERRLLEWQQAGLIDAAAAQAIRVHEAGARRPVALWAVMALGLLALALGIMLIVAANWDLIASWLKLAVHWFATAGAAGAAWWFHRSGRSWAAETSLFVLGVLVLAGLGLHAQVYQLVQPIWQPLFLSSLLTAPALLVLGGTRLTSIGLGLMLGWLAVSIGAETSGDTPVRDGLALALPSVLVLASCLPVGTGADFRHGLREVGLGLLLLGASLAHFAWAVPIDWASAGAMAGRLPIPLLSTGLAVLIARRRAPAIAPVLTAILVTTAAAVVLASALPHADSWAARLTGAVVYGIMWAAIGKAALDAGWRLLFNLAVGAIAARLFIVYFELFGSLATTGTGLIAAGLLIIALALAWRRLVHLRPTGRAASS
jgi:hypothetical protein